MKALRRLWQAFAIALALAGALASSTASAWPWGYTFGRGGAQPPSLALDFTSCANADSRLTISGGAGGTVFDATGTLVSASAPRFDFDPTTSPPSCRGLLVEEQRTNLLVNSKIDGTNLSTQSVSVTAQPYTLSFYGTGTVTLSGAATGAKVGTGAFPTLSSFTFTPSAGTLTLTVSGIVKYGQLEVGSFGTSFIPTAGTAVTRTADSVSMTGASLSAWFGDGTSGTLYVEHDRTVDAGVAQHVLNFYNAGVGTNLIRVYYAATDALALDVVTGGVSQAFLSTVAGTGTNTIYKNALAFAANDFAGTANGAAPQTDSAGTVGAVDTLSIGSANGASGFLDGHVRRLRFAPPRQQNAQLQSMTQ